MSQSALVSNKRLKRKKFFRGVFLVFLFSCFLATGLIVGLFQMEKFKIKNIMIKGNHVLVEEDLRNEIKKSLSSKSFNIIPKNRIFYFSKENLTANLFLGFSRLKNVIVEREYPDSLIVFVEERKPVAVLCNEDGGFFVDENGLVFESSALFSPGVFLRIIDDRESKLAVGQFLLDSNLFKELIIFKKRLDQVSEIEELRFKKDGVFEFHTKKDNGESGWYLVVTQENDLDLIYNNFASFFEEIAKDQSQDLEYVDMRFGNKIFFK
ncbi:MAG: FtsQ-type POTRA domain-containing protein [Patescibacteria group bacterium]